MTKKLLFIINGNPTAGKDTVVTMFEAYCQKLEGQSLTVKNLSSIDLVREAATILGWEGKKNPEDRDFLSDLKDLSTKYNDGPFNYIKKRVITGLEDIYFAHLREPVEIEKLQNYFEVHSHLNIQVISLFIDRKIKVEAKNEADNNVANYLYDQYIDNNKNLYHLQDKVEIFAQSMIDQHLT